MYAISVTATAVSVVSTAASAVCAATGHYSAASMFSSIAQVAGWIGLGTGIASAGASAIESMIGPTITRTTTTVTNTTIRAGVVVDGQEIPVFERIIRDAKIVVETAKFNAMGSIISSGAGAGTVAVSLMMQQTISDGTSVLQAANIPAKYIGTEAYTTGLEPGQIGIGFKRSGFFYHTGLEARNSAGWRAVIDFNKTPQANMVMTGLGRDVPGAFGVKETYDFYLVVDNNPAKVAQFFKMARDLKYTDYPYNAYGRGNPFNCYEGRDWVLKQLGIDNKYQWPLK